MRIRKESEEMNFILSNEKRGTCWTDGNLPSSIKKKINKTPYIIELKDENTKSHIKTDF